MNVEIHKPELVRRVEARIQHCEFHDVDELIEKPLEALDKQKLPHRRPRLEQSFWRHCRQDLTPVLI